MAEVGELLADLRRAIGLAEELEGLARRLAERPGMASILRVLDANLWRLRHDFWDVERRQQFGLLSVAALNILLNEGVSGWPDLLDKVETEGGTRTRRGVEVWLLQRPNCGLVRSAEIMAAMAAAEVFAGLPAEAGDADG